jgi:hypothetical protein
MAHRRVGQERYASAHFVALEHFLGIAVVTVMRGLVRASTSLCRSQGLDGRDKPGHDEFNLSINATEILFYGRVPRPAGNATALLAVTASRKKNASSARLSGSAM